MTKIMRLSLAGFAAGAAVTIAATAQATELNFAYVAYSAITETTSDWTQSGVAVPVSYTTGESTKIAVTGADAVLFPGIPPFAFGPITAVTFNSTPAGGGFNDGAIVFDTGTQIYTGPEAAPVFSPGVFVLDNGVLTISAGAVPEPAGWAMMLAGFGAIGLAARRRRTIDVTYA